MDGKRRREPVNPDKINAVVAVIAKASKLELDPATLKSAANGALTCAADESYNILYTKVTVINGASIHPTGLMFATLVDGHPDKATPSFNVECTDCNIKYDLTVECVKKSTVIRPVLTTTAATEKKSEMLELDATESSLNTDVTNPLITVTCPVTSSADCSTFTKMATATATTLSAIPLGKYMDAAGTAFTTSTCPTGKRVDITSAAFFEMKGANIELGVKYQKGTTTFLSMQSLAGKSYYTSWRKPIADLGFTATNADANTDEINAIVAVSSPAGSTADWKVKYEVVGKLCPTLTGTAVTMKKGEKLDLDVNSALVGAAIGKKLIDRAVELPLTVAVAHNGYSSQLAAMERAATECAARLPVELDLGRELDPDHAPVRRAPSATRTTDEYLPQRETGEDGADDC
ncbi:hypothetical protein PybrP1_006154 [[Pythium] brassicae (nom. inval.)]|nr:hypothetical protein PybrP1_006154 [[Pythium] brassicae (nom. inval.)]